MSTKKDALIDATKELLWEKGFQATSPRDIQTRSGAGQGSFYHHFASKSALAVTALDELNRELLEGIQADLSRHDRPVDAIRDFLTMPRESVRGCRMGRLASENAILDEGINRPVRQYFDDLHAILTRAVAAAQADGDVPDRVNAASLAMALIALVQGGFVLARIFDDAAMHDTVFQGIAAFLFEGDDVSLGTDV